MVNGSRGHEGAIEEPALTGRYPSVLGHPAHHTQNKQRCHEDDQRLLRDSEPSYGSALSHGLNYQQKREGCLKGGTLVVTCPKVDQSHRGRERNDPPQQARWEMSLRFPEHVDSKPARVRSNFCLRSTF
jgi:hypothetical protein